MLTAYREHALQPANSGAQIIAIEHQHRFRLVPPIFPLDPRVLAP